MVRGDEMIVDDKVIVITCTKCNKRVAVPLDNLTIQIGCVRLDDFFVVPNAQCKKCFGVAECEIKDVSDK